MAGFVSYQSKPGAAATPVAFVAAIVGAYAKYGLDPAQALQRAQISPAILADPRARVTAAQFETLSFVAMQELDDEALGWFSRKLPWGAYGLLCRASITAGALGLALRRWARHHRILVDDVALGLEASAGVATLSIEELGDLGAFREFCLVMLLRYALGYCCWAIDAKIPLIAAEFPYPAPPHASVYTKLFTENPRFDAPRAAIAFDAAWLDRPLQRNEADLTQMLKRALPLTVLPYRRDPELKARVQQALRKPGPQTPAAETLAESFNISTRTLHRRLKTEGASLRELKRREQIERAEQALARSTQPIKRVAFLAGFRNEKAFARAFKHWTGETPSQYRARLSAPP